MNNVSQPKRMAPAANSDTTGERHHSIGDSIPAPQLKFTRKDWLVALGLVVITVATRLPYIPPVIVQADGAEYAFALEKIDMARGYPHAPGYPYFIATTRLVYALTNDANVSIATVNIASSALACGALYLLGTAMFGPWVGLVAALLLCSDSNFWQFSATGMAYPQGIFWACIVALTAYLGRIRGAQAGRWSTISAICLGLACGFRQQVVMFSGPMWLWLCRHSGWRRIIGGLLIVAVLCTASIAVMSHWAGGYSVLQASNQAQWTEVIYSSSVFVVAKEGLNAVIQRLAHRISIWSELLFGGHSHLSAIAWLIPLIYAAGRLLRPQLIWNDDRVQLLVAWLLPIMAFHLLIHMLNRGYALIYLPALCLIAAVGIYLFCTDLCQLLPGKQSRSFPACMTVVLAAAVMLNVGVFALQSAPATHTHARQLQSVIGYIEHNYRPEEAVIVQSDARMFYHIIHYYLPQYDGYLLQQTMSPPRPSLAFPSPVRLPDSVTSVIFLNPKARVRPEPELVELPTGATLQVLHLQPGQHYMHFDGTGVRFAANP